MSTLDYNKLLDRLAKKALSNTTTQSTYNRFSSQTSTTFSYGIRPRHGYSGWTSYYPFDAYHHKDPAPPISPSLEERNQAMVKERILEITFLHYRDETSNKGYISAVIERTYDNGSKKYSHETQWGRVGSEYRTGIYEFNSSEEAFFFHNKKVTEQLKQGYRFVRAEDLGLSNPARTVSQSPAKIASLCTFRKALAPEMLGALGDETVAFQELSKGKRLVLDLKSNGAASLLDPESQESYTPGVVEPVIELIQALYDACEFEEKARLEISLYEDRLLVLKDILYYNEDTSMMNFGSRYKLLSELASRINHPGVKIARTAFSHADKGSLLEALIKERAYGVLLRKKTSPHFVLEEERDALFPFWNTLNVRLHQSDNTLYYTVASIYGRTPPKPATFITEEAERQAREILQQRESVIAQAEYRYLLEGELKDLAIRQIHPLLHEEEVRYAVGREGSLEDNFIPREEEVGAR